MKKLMYLCCAFFLCVQCKKENHNTNRITNEDHVIYFCEELSSTESQLVSYDIDNAEKTVLLTNSGHMALESSPVGNKVVLVQENANQAAYRILLFDLQTKALKTVYTSDTTTQISYCSLTTDLQHIYFTEHETNNLYHMYLSIIDTSGTNYKNLDDCNYFLQSPHEIPGYNQIAYVHQTYISSNNEVRVLKRVDFTGNNKQILDTALFHDNDIDVYTNKIIYVVLNHGVILKSINNDGSNKQVIKTDSSRMLFPKFNNNATSITYYSIRIAPPYEGTTFIKTIDMDGNNLHSTAVDSNTWYPFFCYSNDGAFFVISNLSGEVYVNDGIHANILVSNKITFSTAILNGAYFKKDI